MAENFTALYQAGLTAQGRPVVGFDAVGELDPFDELWQLVLPVEPAPGRLRGLDQLEHHDDGGVVGQAAFAAGGTMADGGECALDGVAGADVLPMLGREIVERQQRLAILGQARGCLVVFRMVFGEEAVEGFFGIGTSLGHSR